MLKFINNFPLKEVTTLGIGGPAKKFISVTTQEDLIEAIKYAKENNLPTDRQGLKFLVIGEGSNLLVADKGVDYLVIENEIKGIEQEGNILKVKSGTILQDLVNYSIQLGLSGLQKLTGIPGTVGGAVYGNAGAYGQTISEHLIKVTAFNGQDEEIFTKEECLFNYRDSAFKINKFPILEIYFELEPSTTEILRDEAKEILEKRLVKYPPGIKCPGSFFKNIVAATLPQEILEKIPPEKIVYGKIPAGSLLEEVGAKGDCLGDIYIADYHANLFINKGDGTAEDFYKLAKKYALKVYQKYGIKLEPEVQLLNLPLL